MGEQEYYESLCGKFFLIVRIGLMMLVNDDIERTQQCGDSHLKVVSGYFHIGLKKAQ